MGSTVINQFLAFDLTLQSCPIIAQFTHEFKRQHIDVSTWTLNLILTYYLNRAKTLTNQDTHTLNSTTSIQATVNAAVIAALAHHPSTITAAAAAAKPPRNRSTSNRSDAIAPPNKSVAAPKRTQRPSKPAGTSYCWYHGTCGHSSSVCDKMEELPFTDAHRAATSAISINGQKGSEYSFSK